MPLCFFLAQGYKIIINERLGKKFTVYPTPLVEDDVTIRIVSTTDNSSVSILKKSPVHYTNLSRGDVIDYTFTGYDGQTYSDIVDITSDNVLLHCRLVHTPVNTTTFEEKCTDSQVDTQTDISNKDDDSNRELTEWVPGSTVAASVVASIVAASKYLKYRSRRRGNIVRPV
ncbi:hypothetical protein ScPMuIL_010746 [Solemya velum]